MSEQQAVEADDQAVPETEDVTEPELTGEEASEEQKPSATSEDDDDKPAKPSRAEKRINALTREKYDAQQQAKALQDRLDALETQLQQQPQQPPSDIPKLSDYNFDETAHAQALQQWAMQQRESVMQEQRQLQEQQQAQQQAAAQHQLIQQKIAAGMQKYPDFQAKVMNPTLPGLGDVNPAAFEAVLQSDAAEDVYYYLASNPQEIYDFASMTPVQAIKKVAQIETALKAKPTNKSVPPKPPTRVQGNSEAVKDPANMTTEEFIAWRNEKSAKR